MNSDKVNEQIKSEQNKIADNLANIKHRIVVFSGKGGVGKTTVSVNLAFGLYVNGFKVGILDADVTGPNVPKMIGLTGMAGQPTSNHNQIIPIECKGIKAISVANLITPDQPVIWRGPMRSKLLNQFLSDVDWGTLDYLVADLPPGTGDEILTMTQNMHPNMAIIVTTPQEVSLIDSLRAVNMAKKMDIPHIALIENMSGLNCPNCNHFFDLFGMGGGQRQAKELGITFLGKLPINLETRKLADNGKPIILENVKADISISIMEIIKNIDKILNKN
jgi:Mrp family chromosome partitioning ATPase